MKLSEWINNKINELQNEGYRNVEFGYAINCSLRRNSTVEKFLFEYTNVPKTEVYDVELSKIEEGVELKGSKIRISAIPKGKRKYIDFTYYVGVDEG